MKANQPQQQMQLPPEQVNPNEPQPLPNNTQVQPVA